MWSVSVSIVLSAIDNRCDLAQYMLATIQHQIFVLFLCCLSSNIYHPSVLENYNYSIDPTVDLCTWYPLRLGEPRQCGIWSLPDTSTHGQHWESNHRPSDLESNALFTEPHACTSPTLHPLSSPTVLSLWCFVVVSNSNSARSLSSLNSEPASGAGDEEDDVTCMRERLKALRARAGLDPANADTLATMQEPLKPSLLTQVQKQDSGSNSSLSSSSSLGASLVSHTGQYTGDSLIFVSLLFRKFHECPLIRKNESCEI